jgi:hypothetical protein
MGGMGQNKRGALSSVQQGRGADSRGRSNSAGRGALRRDKQQVRKSLSMLITQPNAAHMLLSRGGRGAGHGAEAITGRARGRARGRTITGRERGRARGRTITGRAKGRARGRSYHGGEREGRAANTRSSGETEASFTPVSKSLILNPCQ